MFLSVIFSLVLLFIFFLRKFIATSSYSLILWGGGGGGGGKQGSEQGQKMNILKISVVNFNLKPIVFIVVPALA